MKKIKHSKSCPFKFKDWNKKNIHSIFAGNACVMAITETGEILQKVADENLAARLQYWENIRSISISQFFPALALGLANDGTCIVSKRALRNCCSVTAQNFDKVNTQINALKDIVEIAVSDAIFALDAFGHVHHIPLCRENSYNEVAKWQDIHHIVVGLQDSVFGITGKGTLVCAGANCIHGPNGNLQNRLGEVQHIIDVCAMGSACEKIFLARDDGSIIDERGEDLTLTHAGNTPVFQNNFLLAAIRLQNDSTKWESYCGHLSDVTGKIKATNFRQIACGMENIATPFVVWF